MPAAALEVSRPASPARPSLWRLMTRFGSAVGCRPLSGGASALLHKRSRRRYVCRSRCVTNREKRRYRIRNWRDYNSAGGRRGSLSLRIENALGKLWRPRKECNLCLRPFLLPISPTAHRTWSASRSAIFRLRIENSTSASAFHLNFIRDSAASALVVIIVSKALLEYLSLCNLMGRHESTRESPHRISAPISEAYRG